MKMPCLLEVNGWDLAIMRLEVIDGQAAIMEGRTYHPFGSVKKSTRVRDGMFVTVWAGYGPEASVTGKSKAETIELLLEAHGFYEVEPNATIPSLF